MLSWRSSTFSAMVAKVRRRTSSFTSRLRFKMQGSVPFVMQTFDSTARRTSLCIVAREPTHVRWYDYPHTARTCWYRCQACEQTQWQQGPPRLLDPASGTRPSLPPHGRQAPCPATAAPALPAAARTARHCSNRNTVSELKAQQLGVGRVACAPGGNTYSISASSPSWFMMPATSWHTRRRGALSLEFVNFSKCCKWDHTHTRARASQWRVRRRSYNPVSRNITPA